LFLLPCTKGSCGNSVSFSTGCKEGNGAAALVCVRREPLAALSCVVNGMPMVSDLECNPFELAETGDHVHVDADNSVVTVWKDAAPPHPDRAG